jgi:hypothetical protein
MLIRAVRAEKTQAAGSRQAGRPARPVAPSSLFDLQPLLGNRAVQALLSREAPRCACGGTCAHCSRELEDAIHSPVTEPSELLSDEELAALGGGGGPGSRRTPLTPVPPSAGGAVICRGGAMEVWIRPTEPAAVQPCERRHEEKHVADFQADPNYVNACQGIPDGEQFTYRNNDDARRFEHAATDVEIACLDAAIPGASAADRAIMEHRRDVTLPAYKRSFASGGC